MTTQIFISETAMLTKKLHQYYSPYSKVGGMRHTNTAHPHQYESVSQTLEQFGTVIWKNL